MLTWRPGTDPYYLTPEERDCLVGFVRRKAAKANRAIETQPGLRDLAGDPVRGERAAKASRWRSLLYALGASPTSSVLGALKGAMDESSLKRFKKKLRRQGIGADDAMTFITVTGWLDQDFKGGRVGVFLVPRLGDSVRVILAGPHRNDEALGRDVPMHEIVELFTTIPRNVSRKMLIDELKFTVHKDWPTAREIS